jgi:microcystin-dependent protein
MPTLPSFVKRLFSFTAFQQGQGDNSFPGTQIDADLDQIDNAVTGILQTLGTFIRADGKLANGVVTRNSLAADLLIGVGSARPWKAGVPYLDGESVTRGYLIYQATQGSIGVDPAADVTNAFWEVVADLSQAVQIAAGGVGTASIADGAVTAAKLAGPIPGSLLGDASVPAAKIAPGLGVVPIGARISYAGLRAPPGWAMEAGQALSRQTYANLFNAITETFKADISSGQTTLTNASKSIQGLGLGAAIVEGPGIPAGTRLVSDADGGLAINNQATATTAQATIRVLPYGQGDGVTTFNVPDSRGRTDFGRDNMTGVGAGRLAQTVDGSALSNSAFDAGAGKERTTIGITNLPTTLPGGKVTVTYPNYNQTQLANPVTASVTSAQGAFPVPNLWQNTANGVATPQEGSRTFDIQGATNPGGSQPFGTLPPTAITNKIIFHGVQ